MSKFLNVDEAAEYLGVSVRTIREITYQRLIDYYKLGGNRYRIEDLDAYAQSRLVPSMEHAMGKNK